MIWGENTNVEHVQNLHKCLCIGKIYYNNLKDFKLNNFLTFKRSLD